MATGEGKTLAAVAAYLHVLAGRGVHVLTVNDYLARRDATLDGAGLRAARPDRRLGAPRHAARASAARPTPTTSPTSRSARPASTTCATSSCTDVGDQVHRPLATAIVDEADSILIDEARVPMVLAGSSRERARPGARTAAALVRAASAAASDYEVAEDGRSVALTDARRWSALEEELGGATLRATSTSRSSPRSTWRCTPQPCCSATSTTSCATARVELVDEMRGRVAQRRRWPDGLQAAVEAKEGLHATAEGEVLGTITVQAYIALYPHLCGMTATAVPSASELREYYKLEVAVIPPHRPMRPRATSRTRSTHRAGQADEALVEEIARAHEKGRPVLVGTLDVEGVRAAGRAARRRRRAVRGAQREERRRGSGDHRRGRRARRGHRLHPDGRPRRRHPPRRQRRQATASGSPSSAASTSSAAAGTTAAASTTSCAAAPAARATRAARSSSSAWRTT